VPRLDVFVANAASLGARVPLVKYPLDVWQHTFRTNVEANLLLLQALDPLLKASDSARVVMLSAGVARQGKATTGSYAGEQSGAGSDRAHLCDRDGRDVHSNQCRQSWSDAYDDAGASRTDEDPATLKTPEDIAPLFVELAAAECQRQGDVINADTWLAERKKT
jgi:NADP-dependent 3-hydroxy acid dehydrogenase YdfG